MNIKDRIFRSMLTALGIVLLSSPASAISLDTQVLSIFQDGSTARVKLGHVAHAATNYNRLAAGGSYIAQCQSPQMMPTTGGRVASGETVLGGVRMSVTIPERQPAYVYMPGFTSLPRGSDVLCTYNWTSFATEGGYTVGWNGISFQTGNGTAQDAGTAMFRMQVPGGTGPNENSSCIP